MDQMPSSARLACLPIALVAISMAFGAPAVRAQSDENATSWREITLDPIMNAVHAVEARLASMEASMALLADSFATKELKTRQLCVSDETGAQTCITKAQLDLLLAKMAQTAAVEPAPVAQDREAAIAAPASAVEAPAAAQSDVTAVPAPEASDGDGAPSGIDTTVDETAAAEQATGDGISKDDRAAEIEQPAGEAIVTAPDPAAVPTETAQQDSAPRDQAPAVTASVTPESSGNGPTSSSDGEISTPSTSSSNE
ncbi:MAG TPA: hypothetical protein VH684_13270 [Xanthobacteraceae bacterium]|jgi:hypothetical protein